MKRLIKTAMAVLLAVMAVSCTSDEEQLVSKSRGTVSVSINGIINGYTPQDATRAVAQNVVRIMWVGGETVYVFEGGKYLGSLTATKGDETGTYAKLSGTIDAPTDGKTLTLVYSPQFTEAPTATGDKISLDLSTQADTYVPFLVYATMPATETTDISSVSVHFDLATSVYKCNCAGLGESGAITQAVIGEVNTVCELTLSADDAPTVSGTTPGNISRTAGFSAADQRAIFSVAVAKTGETAAGRTIEITKGDKKFSAAFDKGSLGTAAAYNTVLVLKEKQAPEGSTGAATRTGDINVNWVQLWEGGPKFAVYNVGATSATDYGGYYAWGGSQDKVDDHNTTNTGSGNLTGADDTATNLWGSNWRMPTKAEFEALLANCNVEWTDNYEGKAGRIFTGKGDYISNSIFLPAAGYYYVYVVGQGSRGRYWSSTPNGSSNAYYLSFDSDNQGVDNRSRGDYGFSVRAVLKELPPSTGTATAKINGKDVNVNWVQLWENGPKFAEYNVGASSTTETGTTMTFADATAENFTWGPNWCTPSKEDMEHLTTAAKGQTDEKVKCDYTREGSQYGFKFTGLTDGYTGNSVFFPSQGGAGLSGKAYYWSATADDSDDSKAWLMTLKYDMGPESHGLCSSLSPGLQSFNGSLVRPVLKN